MFSRLHHNYTSLPNDVSPTEPQLPLEPLEVEEGEGPDHQSEHTYKQPTHLGQIVNSITAAFGLARRGPASRAIRVRGPRRRRILFLQLLAVFSVAYFFLIPLLFPSYTTYPPGYLGKNLHNERVFIAANIIDADKIRGDWGRAVVVLIDIIGPENTFLSIYENDSGPEVMEALAWLKTQIRCRFISDYRSRMEDGEAMVMGLRISTGMLTGYH